VAAAVLGSQPSRRGRYQLRSPRSFIVAGSRTARMIVASIRIAAASPTPGLAARLAQLLFGRQPRRGLRRAGAGEREGEGDARGDLAERLDAHAGMGGADRRHGGQRPLDEVLRVRAGDGVVHDHRAAVFRDGVRARRGIERALDVRHAIDALQACHDVPHGGGGRARFALDEHLLARPVGEAGGLDDHVAAVGLAAARGRLVEIVVADPAADHDGEDDERDPAQDGCRRRARQSQPRARAGDAQARPSCWTGWSTSSSARSSHRHPSSTGRRRCGAVRSRPARRSTATAGRSGAWRGAPTAGLRAADFSLEATVHAYSIQDAYIYGFVLQEADMTPRTADDFAAEAQRQMDAYQDMLADHPHLAEVVGGHVAKVGYDYTTEFLFGLDFILDGLDRLREG
jgi:hypothetical protein